MTVGSNAAGQLGRGTGLFFDDHVMAFANISSTLRIFSVAVSAADEFSNQAYVLALGFDSTLRTRVVHGWGAAQSALLAGISGFPNPNPTRLAYLTTDMKNRLPVAISAAFKHSAVTLDTSYITWASDGFSSAVSQLRGIYGLQVSAVVVDIRDRIPGVDEFVILASASINTQTPVYGVLRGGVEVYRWGLFFPDPVRLAYPSMSPIRDAKAGQDFGVFLNGALDVQHCSFR